MFLLVPAHPGRPEQRVVKRLLSLYRFTSKYATKSSLTIPPQFKRVAALPRETSIIGKLAKI